MANKIFIVAKREYLERVRSRTFVVMTLLVPVLMAAAFFVQVYMATRGGTSPNLRRIRVLDVSGAAIGQRVATTLRADSATSDTTAGPFVMNLTPAELPAAEEAAAREVMKPNSLIGYLVIDDSTLAGKRARYAGRNASAMSDMERLRSAIRQSVMMVRLEHEGVNKATVDELTKSHLEMPAERLTEKGRGGSGMSGLFAGVIVGVMLLMSIIVHGQNVMRGVLEEKSTRVAEIVISSIKPESLLAGKVLGVGGVGLTQIIAWLLLGSYLTNFFLPLVLKASGAAAALGSAGAGAGAGPMASTLGGMSIGVLVIAIVYFLLGFVFYATLFAAVGSMVTSEQEAQQAVMPVMLLLMSGWIFVNPVLMNPNSKLAVVLSWLPWASPILMPIRMGLTAVSPLSVAGSLVVALIGSLGAVWLAARIYRVGMLMYGKKPSLAELAKWIRYA